MDTIPPSGTSQATELDPTAGQSWFTESASRKTSARHGGANYDAAMSSGTHEVLIVGAGFSGIGMAARLKEAGIDDFLLVDDADGFGGTWYWNRYPGIAVDIPSFSYQYSFAKRTSWTRVYAPGEELRDYAETTARRYGLQDKARFRR